MSAPSKTIHSKNDALELLGMDLADMTHLFTSKGLPAYRAKQLFHAIYSQRVSGLDKVSTFSKNLIEQCQDARIHLTVPKIEKRFKSVDGTVRYLISFADGKTVETVWMP